MRADGKRIKNMDPMEKIGAYIMNKRIDAMNMVTLDIPLEPIQDYLNAKRKEGKNLSHMTVLVAAYMRTVAEYPELNRFIVNKKAYARNEYAVSMVVLKAGETTQGTMSKMYFEPKNTIFDVQDIIESFISENRYQAENNSMEKLMKVLLSIPGILQIGVPIFKWMDKHGLLPKSIIDASPFHNSLLISNLASIRTNHIYHHIYEFGTSSLFITMGIPREVPKRENGEIVFEKCMPLGIVMDERIATGSYFAQAFRYMRKYLKNPVLLETPPEVVKEDSGI